jgi:hypothetical protein
MTPERRKEIEQEIAELEADNKFLHLLRIMRLQGELDWDGYHRNGITEEDKLIFDNIDRAVSKAKAVDGKGLLTKESLEKAFKEIEREDKKFGDKPTEGN